MNGFKEMLVYLRKREGYTQRELAKKLNLSTSTIGMYESGQRYPSREIEEMIADFFNVSLDLLRGKVSTERSAENADMVVELMEDARLFEYVKKIFNLPQKDKETVYKYIDFVEAN